MSSRLPRAEGREPRSTPRFALLLATLLLVQARLAAAGPDWLPSGSLSPQLLADPSEPRMAVCWYPGPDRVAASLGGRFPLALAASKSGALGAALEGNAALDLGIEGTRFPLETVDGLFGLRLDAARGAARAVLRFRHLSAHRADGDSTVAFPGRTVSREFWNLELAGVSRGFYAYGRFGSSWHSVPRDEGLDLALGLEWRLPRGAWRPAGAVHWESDAGSGWLPSWSLFGGVETGGGAPLRIGLRWFHGRGPSAQYPERAVDRLGLELALSPLGAP